MRRAVTGHTGNPRFADDKVNGLAEFEIFHSNIQQAFTTLRVSPNLSTSEAGMVAEDRPISAVAIPGAELSLLGQLSEDHIGNCLREVAVASVIHSGKGS